MKHHEMYRKIRDVIAVEELQQECGTRLRRAFPTWNQTSVDPFVLFDDFVLDMNGGFPRHPHMGFEKVTYLLEGNLKHEDSVGNSTVLHAGDVHRLTAGREVYHSEMPTQSSITRGIQLWINLPSHLKDIAPSFQFERSHSLPRQTFDGGCIKTLVGPGSPIQVLTPVVFSEVIFESKSSIPLRQPLGVTAMLYPTAGVTQVNSELIMEPGHLYLLTEEGDLVLHGEAGSKILIVSGERLNQAIHLWGPFVD